jgi:uncharacterized protein YrrD
MKFNFKKISALATSTLMLGMTMGVVAAANYPAPFIQSGAANVAIVQGSGTGVSPLDGIQAAYFLGDLQARMGAGDGGSDVITTGGDSVRIAKASDEFNLGNDAATVFVTSIDKDDLEVLLADGTYQDDDNTEYDYTQKVELGSNLDLTHFSDSDYDDLIGASDETPVIGIHLSGSAHVLNYTFDLTTHPTFDAATLETTTIKLLGKEYYILDVINGTTNKTTLLDTATSDVLNEGDTKTLSGKTVTITYISSTEVKLDVNGEATNTLAEGGTYKLSDGTYVGIKDILFNSKEGTISSVEFSIGTGKLELTDANQIELNDDTVEEITAFLTISSLALDKIVLQWSTDDEEFITPGATLTMPGFEALKLQMGASTIPMEEMTTVEGGSTYAQIKVPLKSGSATIPILYANSTGEFTDIGKDSSNLLVTNNTVAYVKFNETVGDTYFVASWNSTGDAESYYVKADVTSEDSVNKVRFTNVVTGDQTTVANGSDASFGNVVITVNNITRVGGVNEFFYMSLNSGGSLNTIYTAEGMKIYLPYEGQITDENDTTHPKGLINFSAAAGGYSNSTGHNFGSFYLFFDEENKDGDVASGDSFNVTLDESGTTNKLHVATVSTDGSGYELGDSDDFEYYEASDLATKLVHDTGGDYDSVVVTYHGDQMYSNFFLTAPDTTVTGSGSTGTSGSSTPLGNIVIMDSEVGSVSNKNLIVVGGSCINSAAATLVGGAYCGSAWTEKTGVGSGQFLVKGYSGTTLTSGLALLVAGYNAADTVNAGSWSRTQGFDTSKEYKGTSSTSAELVVA